MKIETLRQEGDLLIFEKWDPETELFSGRVTKMKVGFMIQAEWGSAHSTCAISLLKVKPELPTILQNNDFVK